MLLRPVGFLLFVFDVQGKLQGNIDFSFSAGSVQLAKGPAQTPPPLIPAASVGERNRTGKSIGVEAMKMR
jgi:hypothetical protein